MAVVSMKALLESGVHFGHRTNRWNPRMRPYIFTERNGIHIIDLQMTVKSLEAAYNMVRDTVSERGVVLFIGTKRQAQETIQEEATRCGMPYVTERWLGGTLTNWVTIQQRIRELERLEKLRDTGEISRLTKKEGLLIERDINRLNTRLSGIRNMHGIPDLVFVVDVDREATAVHEANLRRIPIIGLVDTNCNPMGIDYVIPSNDDAIRAIKLLVGKIADAVLEGKALRKDDEIEEEMMAGRMATPGETSLVEEELMDVDLFGEATLAKLDSIRAKEVVDEEEEFVEEEIVEKIDLEATPDLPADEVPTIEEPKETLAEEPEAAEKKSSKKEPEVTKEAEPVEVKEEKPIKAETVKKAADTEEKPAAAEEKEEKPKKAVSAKKAAGTEEKTVAAEEKEEKPKKAVSAKKTTDTEEKTVATEEKPKKASARKKAEESSEETETAE